MSAASTLRSQLASVALRDIEPADLPALWLLHSDPRAFEFDTIPPLTTVDQMERVLALWLEASHRDRLCYQLVSSPVTGDVLGIAGLMPMQLGDRWVANTYVRFFPEAWGQGLATTSVAMCLDRLVERRSRGELEHLAEAAFITGHNNAPARRLAERLGFTLSGEEDPTASGEHVVYTLNVDHWAAARQGRE